MNASTLFRYLLGSREAILAVASSRWSLLIGAIFVLSAGLAREYDGEDLLHEPWHALRPLGASIASGTLLFLIVHGAAMLRRHKSEGAPPPFFRAYRTFLSLFWMTAPMAWLYAVPYERFMNPPDAVSLNLWTLTLVATWRVLLMTRVISVVYGIGHVSAFFLVMLFADIVVFAVVTLVPTPVFDIMGGVRHSARDAIIAGTTFWFTILSVLTAPIWILGSLVSACRLVPRWPDLSTPTDSKNSRGLLVLAVCSVLAFAPLLVVSQPEQIRKRETERLLMSGRVREALAMMSASQQSDYPPHWEPPPIHSRRVYEPGWRALIAAMKAEPQSVWVRDIYLPKIDESLRLEITNERSWASRDWASIMEYELNYRARLYELLPEHAEGAQFLLSHSVGLQETECEALTTIVSVASQNTLTRMSMEHAAVRLQKAIEDDDIEQVRQILELGFHPDTSVMIENIQPALITAAIKNNARAITLLLDAGATIEIRDGSSFASPAHYAAYYGSTEALALLLDRGADPYVVTETHGSLIYAAAKKGHEKTVRMLQKRQVVLDDSVQISPDQEP